MSPVTEREELAPKKKLKKNTFFLTDWGAHTCLSVLSLSSGRLQKCSKPQFNKKNKTKQRMTLVSWGRFYKIKAPWQGPCPIKITCLAHWVFAMTEEHFKAHTEGKILHKSYSLQNSTGGKNKSTLSCKDSRTTFRKARRSRLPHQCEAKEK